MDVYKSEPFIINYTCGLRHARAAISSSYQVTGFESHFIAVSLLVIFLTCCIVFFNKIRHRFVLLKPCSPAADTRK